mgnify:FL=1
MKNVTLSFIGMLMSGIVSAQCPPPSAFSTLDINNVSATITNSGDLWWDMMNAGYEAPKGSGINAIFSGSIWIGGLDTGNFTYTAGQLYRQSGVDFFPGPISSDGTTNAAVCSEFDRLWKLDASDISDFISGQSPVEAILSWPAKGNSYFINAITNDLAPFYDSNGDGLYNHEDGDNPLIKGDQAVFWVFNDIGNLHTETMGGQFGLEIHTMAYSYTQPGHVNNATYYDYTLINRSDREYHDTYIGLFTDIDLGNFSDDYVGFDVDRKMAYGYNGDPFDDGASGYGTDLAMVGMQMNKAPYLDIGAESEMHNSTHLTGGGDPYGSPTISFEYYNFLKGLRKDGTDRTDSQGNTVLHTYPDAPDQNGESMCNTNVIPGDYKILMSFGPLTLSPGDLNGFSYSVIWVRDSSLNGSNCPDITVFENAADSVDQFYTDNKCSTFDVTISGDVINSEIGQNNGSINVTISGSNGNYNYAWSDGQMGDSIGSLASGNYTVTVSDVFGCSAEKSFNISEVLGINDFDIGKLSIYPNPSTDGLYYFDKATDENVTVDVFDALGQHIKTQRTSLQIDMQDFAPGYYIIKVKMKSGETSLHKVLRTE